MQLESYDKFEYKYIKLSTSLMRSIDLLNEEGKEGWEVIELMHPTISGNIYEAVLKRKITCNYIK
jgi:hypothetical protein